MAYWTSCRISPGDCENTKTSSQLPAEITQSAQTNTVVQSRDILKCHQQQTVNTDQDKDLTLNPRPPLTLRKGPVLPWWEGQGTCLPLLGSIIRGQPHTQSEVRCHRGFSSGSPVSGLPPLTSTNTETDWDGGWEGTKRKRRLNLIHLLNKPAGPTPQIRILGQTCLFLVPKAVYAQQCGAVCRMQSESALYMLQCVSLLWWGMMLWKCSVVGSLCL